MTYGKLFKKFMDKYPMNNEFSANKCSELSYKELKSMAKAMYKDYPHTVGYRYMSVPKDVLAKRVYSALKEL